MTDRSACMAPALALAALATACAVGNGTGTAAGSVFAHDCFGAGQDLTADKPFDLDPSFFVGEPVDSNNPSIPNALIVRLQRSGTRLEVSDALVFSILDTAAVARCIRGTMNPDGTPAWDPAICDWSTGEGRVLIGTQAEAVRLSFLLAQTCANTITTTGMEGFIVTGVGVGLCPGPTCPTTFAPRGSYVTFAEFGTLPPTPNSPIGDSFKVNFGERLHATFFHAELCDVETINDAATFRVPERPPRLTATMEGSFDFDLDRGQGAQPFP